MIKVENVPKIIDVVRDVVGFFSYHFELNFSSSCCYRPSPKVTTSAFLNKIHFGRQTIKPQYIKITVCFVVFFGKKRFRAKTQRPFLNRNLDCNSYPEHNR